MVMTYKIVYGFVDVDACSIFEIVNADTVRSRGHSMRIVKQHCRTNCRADLFDNRFLNAWNSLPEHVATCGTINTFKRKLNLIDFTKFLT